MYKAESNGTQMISTSSTKERYVQCSAVLGRLQRHSSLKKWQRRQKASCSDSSNPHNELITKPAHQKFSKLFRSKPGPWEFRLASRRQLGGRPPTQDGPWCGDPSSGGSSTRMHPRATPHMRPRRTPRTPELGPEFGSGRGCGGCRIRSTMAQMGSMVDQPIRLLGLSRCSCWKNERDAAHNDVCRRRSIDQFRKLLSGGFVCAGDLKKKCTNWRKKCWKCRRALDYIEDLRPVRRSMRRRHVVSTHSTSVWRVPPTRMSWHVAMWQAIRVSLRGLLWP